MTEIEVRFAGKGYNGSLIQRQLLSRASVKRKSRPRPTKNRVAYVDSAAPLTIGFSTPDSDGPALGL